MKEELEKIWGKIKEIFVEHKAKIIAFSIGFVIGIFLNPKSFFEVIVQLSLGLILLAIALVILGYAVAYIERGGKSER